MSIDTIHELINWQPSDQQSIISSGILLPQTRMIVFGLPKAWKSMLALHTSFVLSTGSDWFGYKTTKCLPFKLQAELPKAVDRLRVIKYFVNLRPPNLLLETANYLKLDSGYGAAALDKSLQQIENRFPGQHIVLILDPLYKLLSGHITDEYDVRKLLDNLDAAKERHNLTIIIIHHSRLTRVDSSGSIIDLGAEEMMGSSYLNNWCDTAVQVKLLDPHTGKKKVRVSFELVRHAETILPSFELEWSRANLHPKVTKRYEVEADAIIDTEDISIRDTV